MVQSAVGIRERTRQAMQAELFTVAMDLFLEQGYEDTTVEQIAAAAGLSRRSFFRYFAGKDDVLAHAMRNAGRDIAGALSTRPAVERPWVAMRRAFDPLIDTMAADRRALSLTRLVLESPSLQAGHHGKQRTWLEFVAGALAPRLGDGAEAERRLEANAVSGAALACLLVAQTAWVAQDGARPLAELLDIAMGAVGPIE